MIIVGHRGAAGEAPENTLAGISHALKLGIRHFEIDIRQCRDGAFAVLHDSNLFRTTGDDVFLHDIASEELTTYFAHRQKSFWQGLETEQLSACYIPTLAQVLAFVPPKTTFQLEIKSDEHTNIAGIVSEINAQFALGCSALAQLNLTFTSFDIELLTQLKEAAPHLNIGVISDEDPLEALEIAEEIGATHCCLKHTLLQDADLNLRQALLNAHQNKSIHVSLWTVNESHLVAEYESLGVQSVITDYPNLLLRELS